MSAWGGRIAAKKDKKKQEVNTIYRGAAGVVKFAGKAACFRDVRIDP